MPTYFLGKYTSVNFRDLQLILLDMARRRVRNGRVTERGLARLSGMSQPHIHNVLKSVREPSMETTDRLMAALGFGIGDLLGGGGPDRDSTFTFTAVPVLRARIGPGSLPIFDSFGGYMPVLSSLAAGLVQPVAARLAPDLVLPRACAANDIVLLDQNPAARSRPRSGVWVIAEDAYGMRIRYARLGDSRLFVFHEANSAEPGEWESLPLSGQNILDIVRARIVWIGREMETEAPGSPGPAGEGY